MTFRVPPCIYINSYINFHHSDDKIKQNLMVWACGTNGNRGGACRVLVGRLERRKHLEELGVDA